MHFLCCPDLQAANNLASMGVASMLLGSPPPAAVPLHMGAPPPAYLAPPMMSPGPAPIHMTAQPGQHFGMQAAMMQAVGGAGFDAAAYGMAGHADMAMQSMAHSPPPRYGGARMGGAAPYGMAAPRHVGGSGGLRGTPGGGGRTMSRFAPSDAVAPLMAAY